MSFEPITTQEQLDSLIQDRVRRAVPSDYEDLKAAAARTKAAEAAIAKADKANQASMDGVLAELQKANDRAEASEKAAVATAFQAKRSGIQAKHKVSDEDAILFLTGADEATLEKQAAALAGRAKANRVNGNFVPQEGGAPATPANGMAEFASQLFGRDS